MAGEEVLSDWSMYRVFELAWKVKIGFNLVLLFFYCRIYKKEGMANRKDSFSQKKIDVSSESQYTPLHRNIAIFVPLLCVTEMKYKLFL